MDVSSEGHVQIARRIRSDGVHILFDLLGYTKTFGSEIFAMRPAPIQVGWVMRSLQVEPNTLYVPHTPSTLTSRMFSLPLPNHSLCELF